MMGCDFGAASDVLLTSPLPARTLCPVNAPCVGEGGRCISVVSSSKSGASEAALSRRECVFVLSMLRESSLSLVFEVLFFSTFLKLLNERVEPCVSLFDIGIVDSGLELLFPIVVMVACEIRLLEITLTLTHRE